ncbi:MAG: acetyl-CoA C-acyltransferase [Candidatus Dormibacteraeota bacterium]|nr:acetyl-CoA C-acyltransferase [Candidatus Dormibacteraeota bacterium]
MPEAVIVAAGRSPIGRASKGSLISYRPDDLLGYVVQKVLEKVPELPHEDIQDLITGCGFPLGEQGMNVGRLAVFLSGLPMTVPGTTVNRFCASSLQSIRMGYHAIKSGEGRAFVCAGVESVSRVKTMPEMEDINMRLFGPDAIADAYITMGMTAENVADKYGVTREEMDEYAYGSQMRATRARDTGIFDREIITVATPDGTEVSQDDGIRPDTTLEGLAGLKPVFKEDGRVTAGNSCPLNDGAAAVVILEAEYAKQLGIKPLARIVGSAVSALDPAIMGVGPIEACKRVFALTGMTVDDIDVVELNEAFAAQVLPVSREVGWDMGKLNPHGGAIALGHPFGMTGARIMTTLINGLQTDDKTFGLESMCVGGGQGMAMIVERLN